MGKPDPPQPPDLGPTVQAAQATAASDAEVARIQQETAREQLAQQNVYAGRSADVADKYAQTAQDQLAFGRQQYNDIRPFLTDYLNQQKDFTTASLSNLQEQTSAAAESRRQATETYNRYATNFAPRETQFVNEAFGYATPARMDERAGAARADVSTAFGAARDNALRTMQGYGLDPTQGAFARTLQASNIAQAAAGAAAGTMARTQTEEQGRQYELAGLEVGQRLPAQAIGQAGLSLQQTASGLGGAAIGGGGIGAANQNMYATTAATGSPTSYASLSNPYTQLAGAYGSQGVNLYGQGNQALGNAGQAIIGAGNVLNAGFSNQMDVYRQQSANAIAPFQILGNVAGMALGRFGMPSDRRFKTDIERVGTLDNGLPVYVYRYVGSPAFQIGLMADEVEKLHPNAVVTDPQGYKYVDYEIAVGDSHG
jgi:hypothetical protein